MELHGVAHIDVEQVVADEAGRDLGRAPRRISPVLLVADLHLEQVVAGGGRVVQAEVALANGATVPCARTSCRCANRCRRRRALAACGDVAAVGEGGAHEIVLAVDAEDAGRHRHQVPLPGHLAAAEDGGLAGSPQPDSFGPLEGRELGLAPNFAPAAMARLAPFTSAFANQFALKLAMAANIVESRRPRAVPGIP